jgi:hypothetical protein
MGELLDLNPKKPLEIGDLPEGATVDTEMSEALTNFFTKSGTHNSVGNIDDLGTGFASKDANLGDGIKGWHFLTLLRTGNASFGVQFASCDTQKALRYRPKIAGTWATWVIIV